MEHEGFLLGSDVEEIAARLHEVGVSSSLAGNRVLITGARGFLGRYFTDTLRYLNRHYLDRPIKILAFDNLITAGELGSRSVSDPNYEFVQRDVTKPFDVEGELPYILHAAGIASPAYYRAHPLETIDVATHGTRRVLDLARDKGSRIVFFSSSEIYGDPDPKFVPTPESYRGYVSCLGPRACYDESKRLGETLCSVYFSMFGVSAMMVRPFNVYGPGMQERDYRVLPNFASNLKRGLPLKLYGNGHQTRTFCYVSDAIVGFLLTLVRGRAGEPYNIGSSTPEVSMHKLADHVERVLGHPVKRELISYPPEYPGDEPNRRCPDLTKARADLGYEALVSLEEGLRRFFGWTERTYSSAL